MTVPLLAAAFVAAACGGPSTAPRHLAPTVSGMDDMPGMAAAPVPARLPEATPAGTGLSARVNGYTVTVAADGQSFHVTGPDGRTVTRYQPYESELMQFDAIRSDLTGYRHVDAAMRQNGTWSVPLAGLPPGRYRGYVTFAAPDSSAGRPLVYQLSAPFTVPGATKPAAQATGATVDGYTVSLTGQPKAGVPTLLRLRITKGGRPVPYFQRYLDGYAHVTAFRTGDLAFAHLTPATGGTGSLTTQALFPESGTWRLFVRFQPADVPLTATLTVDVVS